MLDPHVLDESPELVRQSLAARHNDFDLDTLLELRGKRRSLLAEVESLKAERNRGSKSIGSLMREGRKDEALALREEMAKLGRRISELDDEVRRVIAEVDEQSLWLPNLLAEDTPEGAGEEDNVEVRRWGSAPTFDFDPLDHVDIGEAMGVLDFEAGARIAGSRFAVLKGAAARLNRALMCLFLDTHTQEHGYLEVLTPFLANRDSFLGTGQLPKFADDQFQIADPDHLYLVPTAEVTLTNLHRGEILDGDQLPLKYCGYTPCFRREAGAAGRDTRGLIRQHQFEKVELVQITTPEDSDRAHEELTSHAEALLQKLGLHYRVMQLCSGDISQGAARCYDLEVWLPGQQRYREISSCSSFREYQARRLQTRYRSEKGAKPRVVHTLNGSGLPLGRTLIAVLENYQQADGTVRVPDALQPYLGGLKVVGTPRETSPADAS